jgi:hypothetical protein
MTAQRGELRFGALDRRFHPWRVAESAVRSAIASLRVDSANPNAEHTDQATQPSQRLSVAAASKRDLLIPGLSAMRGAAILKRSADRLTTM